MLHLPSKSSNKARHGRCARTRGCAGNVMRTRVRRAAIRIYPQTNMKSLLLNISLLSFICLLVGCSSSQSVSGGNWVGFTESGQASYYADKYQNKKTASGELYKIELKTAAHNRLPFGTLIKVKNVENGKTVVVKVNDRGPFVKGRIIDLSKSAFDTIGDRSSGVIKVKIEVIR